MLGALVMLLAGSGIATAEMRTWNLKSGATIDAEIVSFPTPQTVKIKRADGKVYTLQAAYLTDDDRSFLESERAKEWKEVSLDKIVGSASGGRYKKCSVSGKDVSGQILVTMLPAQVEPILAKRQQQEADIATMNGRIGQDISTTQHASSEPSTASRQDRKMAKAASTAAKQDESAAKTSLAKLQAEHDDYVKKTKSATTLMMKNTGTVYEGLQVWECQPQHK